MEQEVDVQPEVVEKSARVFSPKPCKTCGKEFTPRVGFQVHCNDCGQSRERMKRSRKNQKAKAEKDSVKINSTIEISKKEARAILAERLKKSHVVEFCADLAHRAAAAHKIPFNKYLLTNGLRATLAKTTLSDISDEEVEGEVLYRRDLYALWDFGFWRQADVTFEQWLVNRRQFKSSAFTMAKMLGKEDFAEAHEEWTRFAPRWNPVGLDPGYTQKEGLAWLDAQCSDTEGGKKRYLLVASRNSMKSTWVRILALCLTITYPDARILIVSETNKLSKKAMKEFRGYLELVPNNPTLFQQYFGEYTVSPDDGSSLVYDNPLAHLGLPQNSVESSSMESANTGSRFDFAIFDDPISRDNGTANEEQRAAAIAKHGSIMKLREPAGFAINIQTPWAKDDLGQVMITRNQEDPESPLAIRIDPVMEIRAEALHKPLTDLIESDVSLNFLPKLHWKFVRGEMHSAEGIEFFKTQYLCLWPTADEEEKLNFTEADIRRNIINHLDVPPGTTVIVGDIAYSVSARADRSSLAVVRISDHNEEKRMTVIDIVSDRMRLPQFAEKLVRLIGTHNPDMVVLERSVAWDLIQAEIQRWAIRLGVSCGIRWHTPSNTKDAKFIRLKALTSLLDADRLKFKNAPYLDRLIVELTRLSGASSAQLKNRKNDLADSLGLTQQLFCPAIITRHEENPEADAMYEEQMAELQRQAHYNRIFGDSPPANVSKASDWLPNRKPSAPEETVEPVVPAKPRDPRQAVFSYKKFVQPSDRTTLFGAKGRFKTE